MTHTATSRQSTRASATRAGAHRATRMPRPTRARAHDEPRAREHGDSRARRSVLLAPLRSFRRKMSDFTRWLARRLWTALRPIARLLVLRWLSEHLPAPLRWLGGLLAPEEHGFGFWWLAVTLGIAVALGMVVALLLAPLAGIVAFLVVAIWALVRWGRSKPHDGENGTARAPAVPNPVGNRNP